MESTPILEAKNLEVKRGGTLVLDVPSLSLRKGEILSLIGPNGAGKTTLLQTLSYLLKPFQGEIFFEGKKVDGNHSVLGIPKEVGHGFPGASPFRYNRL